MRRWPPLLLLAAGATFLASLYMPWQEASRPAVEFQLFGDRSIDGWGGTGYSFGFAAALFALGLVVLGAVVLVRPARAAGLPLARCGLLVGYGAAAVAVDTWYARRYIRIPVHYELGYGAFVGLTAGAAAVVGALALRRPFTRRSLVLAVVGTATLAALALPWERVLPFSISAPGYFSAAAAPGVAAVVWAPVAALVFYGGIATSFLGPGSHVEYGAWIGLGLAALLAALVFRPRRIDLVVGVPALLFVATLYFKWQAWMSGWNLFGAAAAALALALLAASIVSLPASPPELAVGFALLVASQGFALADFAPPGYELGLAAKIGFALAGVLFGAVLFRSRALRPPADRTALRVCATLAVAVYLAVSLVPTWHVLPDGWAPVLLFIPASWLGVAGVLLAVRLAGAWLRPTVEATAALLLPLLLLALIALELVRARTYHLNWGGRIVVATALLLALLGWLEQRGGLERFRLPEILRVDRL